MAELRDCRTGALLHAPVVDNTEFLAQFEEYERIRLERFFDAQAVQAYRAGRLDQLADRQWSEKGVETHFAGHPYRFTPRFGRRERRAHRAYIEGTRDERRGLPWPVFAGDPPLEWLEGHSGHAAAQKGETWFSDLNSPAK